MTERSPERKLTAIVAADVVGYSWLMGADETGTLAVEGAPARTHRPHDRRTPWPRGEKEIKKLLLIAIIPVPASLPVIFLNRP